MNKPIPNIEGMKIYERIYDNPKVKDSLVEKPNTLLGEFELLEGSMDDYSYKVIVKDDRGEVYQLVGKEVSGYYNPGLGGTKHTLIKLKDLPEVKAYLKYS